MGLENSAYWLGNLIFDYFVYLLVIGIYFLMLIYYQISFIYPFFSLMTLIFVCFGLSLLSYTYMMTLLFSNANQAYKLFPLINYFFLFLLSAILELISKTYYPLLFTIQSIIFMIISPFYLLNQALRHMPVTLQIKEEDPLDKMKALLHEQTGETSTHLLV